MLVLSRKTNERIVVGNSIEIMVLEIHGNRVRIGVQAPAGVSIHRKELLERIFAELGEEAPPESGVPRVVAMTDV